jgi:hypothetical protein
MIYDLSFKAKWSDIKRKRQEASERNNRRENARRRDHTFRVNDLILLDRGETQRKLEPKRTGPYQVVRVYDNGTVKIRKENYTQRVSIRRCIPFYSSP